MDASVMPALALRPAQRDHVIGEDAAETRIDETPVALAGGNRGRMGFVREGHVGSNLGTGFGRFRVADA
jgi:hypothetical protein